MVYGLSHIALETFNKVLALHEKQCLVADYLFCKTKALN